MFDLGNPASLSDTETSLLSVGAVAERTLAKGLRLEIVVLGGQ